MFNLFEVARNLGSCVKNAMRNYEKELLEQLRNYAEPELIQDDSDEELAEIWTLTGNMAITDIGDNAFTSYLDTRDTNRGENAHTTYTGNMAITDIGDNAFTSYLDTRDTNRGKNAHTTYTSHLDTAPNNTNHRGNAITSEPSSVADKPDNTDNDTCADSERLTDNHMRYIETVDTSNIDSKLKQANMSDLRINKNDDADDEGSDSDDSSYCDSDDDDEEASDDDDDMFDVCIRESLLRRSKIMPYNNVRKSYYDFDDEDDEDYRRPLTITPIKRRYSVQESLRVMVLRSEAAKTVKNNFLAKRETDS